MKKIIFLGLSFYVYFSQARQCETPLNILNQLLPKKSYAGFIGLPPKVDSRELFALGHTVSEQIYFRYDAKKTVVRSINGSLNQSWIFENDCLVSQVQQNDLVNRLELPEPASFFDDKKLKVLLDRHPSGLIYLWSPSLPLSVEGKEAIKKIAQDLNLPLTILMDPYAPVSLSTDLSAHSKILNLMGGTRHYPALLVYKNQALTSVAHIGRRGDLEWKSVIRNELQKNPVVIEENLSQKVNALDSLVVEDLKNFKTVNKYPIIKGLGVSAFFQIIPYSDYIVDYSFENRYQIHLISWLNGQIIPTSLMGGDPYPFPGGDIIVAPQGIQQHVLNFYTLDELIANPMQPQPVFRTRILNEAWWYSSVGILKQRTPDDFDIRILNRGRSGFIELNHFNVQRVGRAYQFKGLDYGVFVCVGSPSSGPVISRDGRYFVGQDSDRNNTIIYQIPDDLSRPCLTVKKLPFSVYKVTWDPEGKNIFSFSVRTFTPAPDLIEKISHYIYNIDTDVLTQLPEKIDGCELRSFRMLKGSQFLLVCEDDQHLIVQKTN